MSTSRKYPEYFDTGGPGTIPTSRGEAAKWWVPYQYTSVQRLLMATRLAIGPATVEGLQILTHANYCGIYQILRNWAASQFVEWTMFEPADPLHGSRFRIATLAPRGREALWRFGWVTRRLRFSEYDDAPLRTDVPDDPLEALRLHARQEFLRPAALSLLWELIGWGRQSCTQLGANIGNYPAAIRYLNHFRTAGYVTDIGERAPEGWCISFPRWILNNHGHDTLDRHIDALRRVAGASGYQPTRSCELYYPNAQNSPCAESITPTKPPQCPDCPHRWLAREEAGE